MYFAKNEIIVLNDHKKYLVLDSSIINNEVYYKIKEVNNEENKLLGNDLFIKTINKNSKIYIDDRITPDEINQIRDTMSN